MQKIKPIIATLLAFLFMLPAMAQSTKPDAPHFTDTQQVKEHYIPAQDEPNRLLGAGDDFEYDGLIYTVIDPEAHTCRTKEGNNNPGNVWEDDLVIPEKVSYGDTEYNVIEIGKFGFYKCSSLTSITLPNGLTTIGRLSFWGCSGLTSIIFPNSLTSIETFAFENCEALNSIVLPESLTAIGAKAFKGCLNITSVTYNAVTPISNQSDIFAEEVYENAILDMPNASLADIMSTNPWKNFKHIEAKDGVMPPVLVAGDDFEYDGLIYTVIDAEGRTCRTKAGNNQHSGNMWEGDLVIPGTVYADGTEFSVVEIGDFGFWASHELTSIDLPETIISLGEYAFGGCRNLTSVDLPESLSTLGTGSFSQCESLSSVVLPPSITTLGYYIFSHCESLTSVTLPENLTAIGPFTFWFCENLTSIELPETLTTIEEGTFNRCENLKEIVIPESVTKIGKGAFINCMRLNSVTLPASLSRMDDEAFAECRRIASVNYGAYRPIAIDSEVFSEETYYNAILNMPNAPLSNILYTESWNLFKHIQAKDGSVTPDPFAGMDFEYNGLVYTVIDPETRTCRTREGDRVLSGNVWDGDLLIPETVSVGNTEFTVVEIGEYGFFECSGLTSIVFPNTLTKIGGFSFCGCTGLTSLDFPTSLNEIDLLAFSTCTGLTSLDFPNSLTTISYQAFEFCSGLTSIILPESVTTLDFLAFRECQNIESVIYNASMPLAFHSNIFDPSVYSNAKLTMPNAFLADVLATEPWNKFERIVAKDGSSDTDLVYEGIDFGIDAQDGAMWLKSETDRTVSIYRIDGVCVRTVGLKAGETVRVADLAKGIYIVAGRKIIMR